MWKSIPLFKSTFFASGLTFRDWSSFIWLPLLMGVCEWHWFGIVLIVQLHTHIYIYINLCIYINFRSWDTECQDQILEERFWENVESGQNPREIHNHSIQDRWWWVYSGLLAQRGEHKALLVVRWRRHWPVWRSPHWPRSRERQSGGEKQSWC